METIMLDSSDGAFVSSEEDEPLLIYQQVKRSQIHNPIVYTTKLDDMKIFKNGTSDMDGETIINSIIKESKPKLTRKRKCTPTTHSSNEDLLSSVNSFNTKLARTVEDNKRPICKPVRVVVEDIKYTLLRTQSNESRNSEPVKETRPFVNDEVLPPNRKHKSTLIFDRQHQEADMYSLDKNFLVKEHKKFLMDGSNDDSFRSLKLDKNLTEVSCCCWYVREKYLFSRVIPHETLRYMRKPHRCPTNFCCCCCKNKNLWNDTSAISPLKQSESISIWLYKMTEKHTALPLTLLSKSLCVFPKYTEKKTSKSNHHVKPAPEKELPYFLHSTGIDFGEEYYAIGADGHIKVSLKNTGKHSQKFAKLKLKTTNNIVGKICCWYRREEFADRLLQLGALPNTANHIRSTHPCSSRTCSCCCKPSNKEKPELALTHKVARHTNDLVSKKVKVKVIFPIAVKKPVTVNPVSVRSEPLKNTNNIVSFNVSLSALQTITKGKGIDSISKEVFDCIIPESTTIDTLKTVRVLVNKKGKKVVIESNTPLRDLTTEEIKLLDIIFCAVNKATKQLVAQDQPKRSPSPTIPTPNDYYPTPSTLVKDFLYVGTNTIYPLLLNTQLSIATDLRNKRFLPSLRAHLLKYNLPKVNNSNSINMWMYDAMKSDSANTANVETNKMENNSTSFLNTPKI